MSVNRIPFENNLELEFIMTHLRAQIASLGNVVETIERTHSYHDDYVRETLKIVEAEIRKLKRLLDF